MTHTNISNDFVITSQFSPTGDQPQAIRDLTKFLNEDNQHQTLLGVTGSGKTFTLANVIAQTQRPTLIISHNKTLAAQLYQEFRDFFPQNAVNYFVSYYDYYQPESYIPATDTYIEKETDINDEIDKLRLSTTTNLLTRNDCIVIASVSCIYNLGSPLEFAKKYIRIVPGQVIDPKSLTSRLIDIQYTRSDYELKRGSFRLRGDTLQIWPADEEYVLDLSLLDGVIESIQKKDPVSFLPIQSSEDTKQKRFTIYPAKHYQSNLPDNQQAFQAIKSDLAQRIQYFKSIGKTLEAYRIAQKVKYDLEMIQELGYVNGIENYSRYFDGRQPGDPPYTLLDYFHYNQQHISKQPFLTIIDESHITIPQLRGMYAGDQSRKQTLIDYGFRLPSAIDNRPLKFEEIMQRLGQTIYVSATPEQWELDRSGSNIAEQLIRPTGLVDPIIQIKPTQGQIIDLVREIIARKHKGQRVLVTTLTKATAEALTEYLNDAQKIQHAVGYQLPSSELPQVQYLHADIDTLERSDILASLRAGEYDVVVGINLLREGLDLPEVSLVAIIDADKQGFLRSKTSLIQTMGRAARHQDGTVILYADQQSTAMQQAIAEVNRRRQIQLEYNKKYHIIPTTISKPIRDRLLKKDPEDQQDQHSHLSPMQSSDLDIEAMTPKDKQQHIKKLTKAMNQAAVDWDFETAAELRDTIAAIRASE